MATYPGSHQLLHYHADDGAELIDQRIKSYLLQTLGLGSRGAPKLNSILERKLRAIGEMTVAMLADSGLPKSFWWDAYVTACDIVWMMFTRTCRGWMSLAECVPGGQTPNLSLLQRWGCKVYVLVPKADRHKDWNHGLFAALLECACDQIQNWIRACIFRRCSRSLRRAFVLPTKSGSLHYPVMLWIGLREWSRSFRAQTRLT